MIPTETLVANRAMISPLMARNAARGLSESRRPARRAAGRLVRDGHEPGADHGQPRAGDDQTRP